MGRIRKLFVLAFAEIFILSLPISAMDDQKINYSLLPNEILIIIMEHLQPLDLENSSLTCAVWNHAANQLWPVFFKKEYPIKYQILHKNDPRRNWKKDFSGYFKSKILSESLLSLKGWPVEAIDNLLCECEAEHKLRENLELQLLAHSALLDVKKPEEFASLLITYGEIIINAGKGAASRAADSVAEKIAIENAPENEKSRAWNRVFFAVWYSSVRPAFYHEMNKTWDLFWYGMRGNLLGEARDAIGDMTGKSADTVKALATEAVYEALMKLKIQDPRQVRSKVLKLSPLFVLAYIAQPSYLNEEFSVAYGKVLAILKGNLKFKPLEEKINDFIPEELKKQMIKNIFNKDTKNHYSDLIHNILNIKDLTLQ